MKSGNEFGVADELSKSRGCNGKFLKYRMPYNNRRKFGLFYRHMEKIFQYIFNFCQVGFFFHLFSLFDALSFRIGLSKISGLLYFFCILPHKTDIRNFFCKRKYRDLNPGIVKHDYFFSSPNTALNSSSVSALLQVYTYLGLASLSLPYGFFGSTGSAQK